MERIQKCALGMPRGDKGLVSFSLPDPILPSVLPGEIAASYFQGNFARKYDAVEWGVATQE